MNQYRNRHFLQHSDDYNLAIIDAGDAHMGSEWIARDVFSSFSRLYYILKGEGCLHIGSETIRMTEGNMYLIPARLKFNYDCESYMNQLYFHVNLLHRSGLDMLQGCGPIYQKSLSAQKLEKIQTLYHSLQIEDAIQLKGMLWEEIADFIRVNGVSRQYKQNYSPLTEAVFQLAQNPINVQNHVSRMASCLHVSVSTLTKRFRQETGMTLSTYLNQLVINKACYLLHTTDSSISDIAKYLGFSDQFYFAKYFRKGMDMPPSVYRQNVRKEYFAAASYNSTE